LAAGVPTVVTAVGAARELPDQAVVKVTPDVRPDLLGHMLLALLDDAPRRASMRATAQGYARERSFEHAAQFLYEEVVLGRRRAGNLVAA
jgi:glycosyltransferase involved in cell wall biosynthesis